MQLQQPVERLIFQKLVAVTEVLCEAKARLCSHLWQLNTDEISSKQSHEDNYVEITDLVYEHTLVIEKAMTYLTLLIHQLNTYDIRMLLETTDFDGDPLPYSRCVEVINQVLPMVKDFKKN